jgi:DNA modification methylase
MADERAVLMATDPPYLVDYDGSGHPDSRVNKAMTKDKRWDEYKDPAASSDFFADFIGLAFDVGLTERAPIYQWHADLRRHLVQEAWNRNGLLLHQGIIWVKSRGVLNRSHYMWQHEPAVYGWKQGMQPETDRRPPANATTVWQIDQQGACNDIHPTEKPVELFARPIGWHTRPGEICYEPFSGSGTQIIAAHGLGRRCYAIEIAPQYVDVACRRFQEHTGTKPVLEATGEVHDFTKE